MRFSGIRHIRAHGGYTKNTVPPTKQTRHKKKQLCAIFRYEILYCDLYYPNMTPVYTYAWFLPSLSRSHITLERKEGLRQALSRRMCAREKKCLRLRKKKEKKVQFVSELSLIDASSVHGSTRGSSTVVVVVIGDSSSSEAGVEKCLVRSSL